VFEAILPPILSQSFSIIWIENKINYMY
jgi:hypothetical protein